jgi:protein involved in polysaccharide export with SLBB domain
MVEDPLLAYEGLISASGTVPVPFYGEFMLARMTPAEASEALAAALTESVYEKATISVTLVTKGPGKVYVYGAVRRPGVVGMPTVGGLSIIQVLSFVEGMTSWASPEETFVIRRGKPGEPPQKITINLKEILSSSEALVSQDVQLQADDIICVPGIDGTLFFSTDVCEVIVTGEVRVPGIVPFAPGEQRTLMRAILKAGGFSKFARSDRVRLVRIEKGKDRQERTIDAGRIIEEGRVDLDIDLQPGDMIIIPLKAFAL